MNIHRLMILLILLGIRPVVAQSPPQFIPVDPTGLPYSVVIESISINGNTLLPGDDVGVFDNDLCVGSIRIDDQNQLQDSLQLVVWEEDLDHGLPGFTAGSTILVKIASQVYGSMVIYIPDLSYTIGDGTFGSGNYSVVSLIVVTPESSVLSTNTNTLDFSGTPVYSSSARSLIIRNQGDYNLLLFGFELDLPYFSAEFQQNTVVPPAGEAVIPVSFHPQETGYHTDTLRIYSNDASHSPVHIHLTGVGVRNPVPNLVGLPDTLKAGFAGVEAMEVLEWQVVNTGNGVLNLWDMGTDESQFQVAVSSIDIAPGEVGIIPIQFTPDRNGLINANFSFSHNDPDLGKNWIHLTGIGYDDHFNPVNPTGLAYTIIVDSIAVDHFDLNFGDEVAVFDGSVCVGVGIRGLTKTIQITAWEKDPYRSLPGYTAGHSISFKSWSYTHGQSRSLDLTPVFIEGNGIFGQLPLTRVTLSGSSGLFAKLQLNQSPVVFDPTSVGDSRTIRIPVSNSGNGVLEIWDPQSSIPVFYSNRERYVVDPGRSSHLEIIFTPEQAAYYQARIVIKTNDPQYRQVIIPLEGMGVPELKSHLTVVTPKVEFPPTVIGETTTTALTIRNSGNQQLTVNFLESSTEEFQVYSMTMTVESGDVLTIPIQFSPQTRNRISGRIRIYSPDAGNGEWHAVQVNGIGYDGHFQPVNPTGLPYHVVVDSIVTFNQWTPSLGDEIGIFDQAVCVGNGVVTGAADLTTQGSLLVDGTGDYADCGRPELMMDSETGTVEAWVNPSRLFSDHWFFSYSMDDNDALALCILSNGALGYQMNSGGVNGSTDGIIPQNQWSHVALTWNNSEVKLYINGTLDKVINQGGYPTNSGDHLYLGIDSFNRDNYSFYGALDEVRVWNLARNEGDIFSTMSTSLASNPPGLIGYWNMDGNVTNIIPDVTGNGGDGSLQGDAFIISGGAPVHSNYGEKSQIVITTWGEDVSRELAGFRLGEPMTILVHSKFEESPETIPASRIGLTRFTLGDGRFGTSEMSVVTLAIGPEVTRRISLSEEDYQFGSVQIDSISTRTLTIKNSGNQPLNLSQIANNNPDFSLNRRDGIALPGDSLEVELTFQPSRVADLLDTIRLYSDASIESDQIKYIFLSGTGSDSIAPFAPQKFLSHNAPLALVLTWNANTEGDMDKYRLYRGTTSPPGNLIAEIPHPDTSYTDINIVNEQLYFYQLTAVDTVGNESPMTVVISAIYENYAPVLELLTHITQEQHARVSMKILVSDVEQDPVTFEYKYAFDAFSWEEATGAFEQERSEDTVTVVWNTGFDIPSEYRSEVYFQVTGSDAHNSTMQLIGPFPVDNHVGHVSIIESALTGEQSNRIAIPYLIEDPTGDQYTLAVTYSIDSGKNWTTAKLNPPAVGIGTDFYRDSVFWESIRDLPNLDDNLLVAMIPNDGWQDGHGDTITVHLDNQFLPALESYTPSMVNRGEWHDPFTVAFTRPLDVTTFSQGIQVQGTHFHYSDFQYEYNSETNAVMLKPASGWSANDSVFVVLTPNLKDTWGNPFDGNGNDDPDGSADRDTLSFAIHLLADYDHNDGVDFEDLVTFQQAWWSDDPDLDREVGPAVGSPPYLQVQADSILDFEDLMVFVQMWNWTIGFDPFEAPLAKEAVLNKPWVNLGLLFPRGHSGTVNESVTYLVTLDSLRQIGAFELLLIYDPIVMEYVKYSHNGGDRWVALHQLDEEFGVLKINMADLRKKPGSLDQGQLKIEFHKQSSEETELHLRADIRDRQGVTLFRGRVDNQATISHPVPRRYALHQNYPNPFNPVTTIRYDLPEDANVRLLIFNLLGQEIIVLQEGFELAGFKSLQWDGKDMIGHSVAAGVYILLIKTDRFQASRKLIFLK